jgi:hypothetical protein
MALVRGIRKQTIIVRESTPLTLEAAATASKMLRRVNGNLVMTRDAIRSQEILPSAQVRDTRLGAKRAQGSFSGQLSPGAYPEFFEGMFRKAWTNGVSTLGAALGTVTAVATPPATFTRSTGSYLTEGYKVGDVVRFAGFGNANDARNYRISNLTATVLTVTGTGNEVVVAGAGGASSVTLEVVGQKTWIPQSGHENCSYSIEQWFPDADTAFSERYSGVRVAGLRLNFPANGMSTIDASLIGRDMSLGTAAYFSNVSPMTTDNSFIAVSGTVKYNGSDIALILGASINIQATVDANPVIGSNLVPDIFTGVISVDGQFQMYTPDKSQYELFDAETEVDLNIYLTSTTAVNSPFMAINLSRVKTLSATKSDSDRAIIQSVQFVSLENAASGGSGTKHEATSVSVQDSSL